MLTARADRTAGERGSRREEDEVRAITVAYEWMTI